MYGKGMTRTVCAVPFEIDEQMQALRPAGTALVFAKLSGYVFKLTQKWKA